MVGWVRWMEVRRVRFRFTPVQVLGFPLLALDVPPGNPERRGRQVAKRLRSRGVTRALLPPELEGAFPAVDSLPLCRALAPRLALALLEGIPLRERRVMLRGETADRTALALADAICPQVSVLYLDFDRGAEELSGYLRSRYGVPPRPPGQVFDAQLSIEFSPREERVGQTLRLWGEPDLLGLKLSLGAELPGGLPPLSFLTLLWESGRVKIEDIILGKP